MTLTKDYKQQWLGNVKGDLLAGLVSALAIIPEVIGFTIVAGVSPMVGLYTSFCFTILLSFFGGRPAMVSAAAGSMALVIVNLVRNYGVEYLFAATILAGLIQLVLGIFKVGNLLKFIPNTVMVGFVDALAILIFISQINTLAGEPMVSYILTIIGIGIVYLFPKITKAIPAGLVAIIVVAVIGAFVG